MKERLGALENQHKLVDPKESEKPTQWRASSGADRNGQESKKDDDRPTLKRRGDEN